MNELDKEKEITRDLSKAVTQNEQETSPKEVVENSELVDKQGELEKLVDNDMNVIRTLMGIGLITREQGQNLMKQVISKAYDSTTKQQVEQSETQVGSLNKNNDALLDEFIQQAPDFFNKSGREDVLSYLRNSNVSFDKDELLQISKLIEAIEKGAVDRYLKKVEYGKTLNDENSIAKQRLIANAQGANASDSNWVFTRAQIGKMSGDEFAKYEASIMEQLKRGLIK